VDGRRLLPPLVHIDVVDFPGCASLIIMKNFYYLPKDNVSGDESHFGDKKSQAKPVNKPRFFCLTY